MIALPQSRRFWIGGGAAVAAVIVAASYFLLTSPELAKASDLHEQAAGTRQSNLMLTTKLTTLKAKTAKLDSYTKSLRDALSTLPYDSGLPAFTRQITAQAAKTHVHLLSVSVGGITAAAGASAPAAGAT